MTREKVCLLKDSLSKLLDFIFISVFFFCQQISAFQKFKSVENKKMSGELLLLPVLQKTIQRKEVRTNLSLFLEIQKKKIVVQVGIQFEYFQEITG